MFASVYIACRSALLYIKTLFFFLTVLALSAAATVANIKIGYDAKTPQFAIFGKRVICVFYSIAKWNHMLCKLYINRRVHCVFYSIAKWNHSLCTLYIKKTRTLCVLQYSEVEPHAMYAIYKQTRTLCVL